MRTALFDLAHKWFSLSWLTGPIFDKELRVSSRRRRNYVIRFFFLALLTLFVVLVWIEATRFYGSRVYQASRMARAGRDIVTTIVWFQFCATQLLALVMLSTSISDEIYNKTLGTLMTTPINSFQIVIGKLFSKLLQLFLFLAISLPLLAIVRVFGGVPWDYVIASLCITITTILFVGSLSLFFSIFCRRAYVVIIMTLLTLGLLFALLPLFFAWIMFEVVDWDEDKFMPVLILLNPYMDLAFETLAMQNPRFLGMGRLFLSWPLHCAIMLVGSVLIITLAVIRVRIVALRQAVGFVKTPTRPLQPAPNTLSTPDAPSPPGSPADLRTVHGAPVLWKELRSPILGRHKIPALIITTLAVFMILISYAIFAAEHNLDDDEIHMAYAVIFMGLGMLFTIVLPATGITSEKEARSWPLLLASPITDGQILYGKFVGALRRCLPIWIFLFAHLALFILARIIHPLAYFQMFMIVTWIMILFCSSGLYFSARFKRTTTAVIANFALGLVFWALIPFLLVLTLIAMDASDNLAENYCDTIPFVQAIMVMDYTCENGGLDESGYWPSGNINVIKGTWYMFFYMILYSAIGLLFLWRAKHHLRRRIF